MTFTVKIFCSILLILVSFSFLDVFDFVIIYFSYYKTLQIHSEWFGFVLYFDRFGCKVQTKIAQHELVVITDRNNSIIVIFVNLIVCMLYLALNHIYYQSRFNDLL